jgi:hypothetical protein
MTLPGTIQVACAMRLWKKAKNGRRGVHASASERRDPKRFVYGPFRRVASVYR